MKIAILNTDPTSLGVFLALRVALTLETEFGDGAHLVLGAVAGSSAEHQARRILAPWCEVRRMRVQRHSAEEMHKVFGPGKWEGEYERPTDGGLDFRDCDLWMVVGPGFGRQLAPLAPYVVLAAENPWRMRLGVGDLALRLGVRRTMQAARLVWISCEEDVGQWRMLCDVDDENILVGSPVDLDLSERWPADDKPCPSTRHILRLVSQEECKLLRVSAACPPHCVAPILDDKESLPGHRFDWSKAQVIEPSLETLLSIAALANGMVVGPTRDSADPRVAAARALGTPIAMLWAPHLGESPAWVTSVLIEEGEQSLLDDRIVGSLAQTKGQEMRQLADVSVVRRIGVAT